MTEPYLNAIDEVNYYPASYTPENRPDILFHGMTSDGNLYYEVGADVTVLPNKLFTRFRNVLKNSPEIFIEIPSWISSYFSGSNKFSNGNTGAVYYYKNKIITIQPNGSQNQGSEDTLKAIINIYNNDGTTFFTQEFFTIPFSYSKNGHNFSLLAGSNYNNFMMYEDENGQLIITNTCWYSYPAPVFPESNSPPPTTGAEVWRFEFSINPDFEISFSRTLLDSTYYCSQPLNWYGPFINAYYIAEIVQTQTLQVIWKFYRTCGEGELINTYLLIKHKPNSEFNSGAINGLLGYYEDNIDYNYSGYDETNNTIIRNTLGSQLVQAEPENAFLKLETPPGEIINRQFLKNIYNNGEHYIQYYDQDEGYINIDSYLAYTFDGEIFILPDILQVFPGYYKNRFAVNWHDEASGRNFILYHGSTPEPLPKKRITWYPCDNYTRLINSYNN